MIAQETIDEAVRRLFSTIEFTHDPQGLYDPLRYMVAIGGKRIRPKLCLTVYSLFNDTFGPEILGPAAGLEVFHTFTLIHDDMMDRSALRRGHATVWKKWSADTAILSGDVMCIDSYKRIAKAPAAVLPQAMALFSKTAAEVCDGQQYDMEFETAERVSMEQYMQMIGLKTGVLIACAAKMGALVAGAPAKVCDALYDYGYDLGLAFQVADDYLDAYGDEKVFGKPIGGDILNNKKSWLTVRAEEVDAPALETAMHFPAGEDKIARVKAVYDAAGVPRAAREEIVSLSAAAISHVEGILAPNAVVCLREFADSLVGRTF